MTAFTTVSAFLKRASIQLMDSNPQFKRWSSAELVEWMNDGAIAVAKFMPWSCARVDVIKLSTGTRQSIESIATGNIKPGDGSTPSVAVHGNFLQFVSHSMGSDGLTPGRSIRLVDRDVLDAGNPNWHSPAKRAAMPTQYVFDPRTPKYFWVCPGVTEGVDAWVEAGILFDPVRLSPATDYSTGGGATVVIPVDDKFTDELLNYVLARAYMKDAEDEASTNLVAVHSKLFTDSVNAQAKAMTGVNPNLKSLPMTGTVPATAS